MANNPLTTNQRIQKRGHSVSSFLLALANHRADMTYSVVFQLCSLSLLTLHQLLCHLWFGQQHVLVPVPLTSVALLLLAYLMHPLR